MVADMPDEFRAAATARQPIRRFADPSEIGGIVVWLCSDAASFVTGAALAIDGGASAM